jgi:HAD superfamily hydrolase (TIGR01509 family)
MSENSLSSPPRSPLEAVVFDMDGVLVDTEPMHLEMARRLVAPAELPVEEYARFIGTHGFGEWLEETYGVPREVIRTRSSELFFAELAAEGLRPMPGATALIEAVLGRGLKSAVVTMTQPDWTEATLRAAGLREYFEVVVTAHDVAHGKPAPDLYLHAAEQLVVDPRRCMAVEDSVHGIASAHAAGMRVVQLRQATFVPEPQAVAEVVLGSLGEFDLEWLDRDGDEGRR